MSVTVTNQRGAPYEITADGTSLPPDTQLIEVRVEQTIGMADRAILRIADPAFATVDADTLAPGTALTIKLGAPHTTAAATEIFNGEVVALEAEMDASGVIAVVTGLDKSHRMRRNTSSKAYNNMTVSDIAQQLLSTASLEAGTIQDTGGPRTVVIQDGESDWQLLERLFDEIGCDITMVGGKFTAPLRVAEASTPVELTLGTTLRSFRPRLSGVAQVDSVEVRAWDPTQKTVISATADVSPAMASQSSARDTASSALGGGALVVVDHPAENAAVAQAMATGVAHALGSEVIEATGVALGDPSITAGGVVTVTGAGQRFSGGHQVVSATHVLRGRRGYETRFCTGAARRPLARDLQRRRTSGGFSAHLAIGLVTQNDDSENQARIKVNFPVLDEMVESDWIRVAYPAAGSDRGVIALPQINDEVVVGFEHGDVNRPIMLGALYNGATLPGEAKPSTATPQGLQITVPGDVVTTATGKVTTAATEDVSLSSTGGSVTVAAQGEQPLKVTSNSTMELTAQETQKLSGLTTTVQGETQVQVSSSAAVQITSDGSVEISGASITISADGALVLNGATVMLG